MFKTVTPAKLVRVAAILGAAVVFAKAAQSGFFGYNVLTPAVIPLIGSLLLVVLITGTYEAISSNRWAIVPTAMTFVAINLIAGFHAFGFIVVARNTLLLALGLLCVGLAVDAYAFFKERQAAKCVDQSL